MFVYNISPQCCAAVAVCIVSIYRIQLTMKKTVALRMKCLRYYCVGGANRPCPGATRDVCCTLALLVCVCESECVQNRASTTCRSLGCQYCTYI